MTTRSPRREALAEHSAAWTVMKADRRFLWLWLSGATALSVGFNVGHAWLSPTAPAPLWQRVAASSAPPVLLMLAIHGLPALARMLGRADRDRLLTAVVWGVVSGAFAWSAFGIYRYAIDLGTPASVAWVAPLTIDLSVFGATRGLVLTAPIAARMKAGLEPAPAADAPERISAPAKPRSATSASVRATAASAKVAAPATAAAASAAREPAAPRPAASAPVTAAAASPAHHERAAAIVAAGVTAKAPSDVALVLQLLDGAASDRRIAAETRIDARTVARIRKADAGSAAEPARLTLSAVV